MFDPLLENLHEAIKARGGEPIKLPAFISKKLSDKDNGVIKNWLWKVPGFRRWRVTRFDVGKKLQVLNSVAYPDYSNDQPLLGIDLLWFGSSEKLVSILDFQPLIQDKLYLQRHFQGLKSLKKKFPHLSTENNMRSFDPSKYFSPWLLFCRGGLDEAKDLLPIAFQDFVKCYWDLYETSLRNRSIISAKEVERLQVEYDVYSAEKDPAHRLFLSYFGEQWTDMFVNDFLFPKSKYKNSYAKDLELDL